MTVEHIKRLENQRRGFAQVSELSGAKVEVKADNITDQGTAWRANAGKLKIEARQHQMQAAENTQENTVQRLAYGGDVRLDTSTGEDLNVRAAGKGGSLDKRTAPAAPYPAACMGNRASRCNWAAQGIMKGRASMAVKAAWS